MEGPPLFSDVIDYELGFALNPYSGYFRVVRCMFGPYMNEAGSGSLMNAASLVAVVGTCDHTASRRPRR